MKKIFTLFSLILTNLALAATTVDLDGGHYTCNGAKITYETPEAVIRDNCHEYKFNYSYQVMVGPNANNIRKQLPVVANNSDPLTDNLARARFVTDKGILMYCYYRNHILYKCKADITKHLEQEAKARHEE